MPTDIAAVLGIDGTDLGTICVSNAINPWAKWKPVSYASVGIVSDSVRASMNYGLINIPTWSNTNILHMSNFMFGTDRSSTNYPDIGIKPVYWGYQHPTGGSNSPFRLHDFSNAAKTYGYYHDADAPIGGSLFSEYTIDSGGNLTINFKRGDEDVRTISLSDLSYPSVLSYSVSNMYMGVMMRNVSTGTVYAATRSATIGAENVETSINITGLDASYNGTYQIFPFLSSHTISFTSSLGQVTGKYIALQEAETVGIGSTITRMDILEHSLGAYRDTSSTGSTRYLYVNISLQNNVLSPSLSATAVFTVYDSTNTARATATRSVTVSYGNVYLISTTIDMGSYSALNAAYSVQVVVTPTQGTNPVETSASVLVSDGPSPYV